MYSTSSAKQPIRSTSVNDNDPGDPISQWNDNDYLRTPSLTNLRVSTYRRICSSACCLNIILLCLVFIMMIGITIFALKYYELWPEKINTQTKIDCGQIEGFVSDGIIHYLGIPYALPPLGLHQFKKPVELLTPELCQQAWLQSQTNLTADKFYETKHYQPKCLQLEPRTDRLVGHENCLYLNIHIPITQPNKHTLKPVIVLFDGLFFMYNGQSFTRPHPLTLKQTDAIHVTFNYRIGPMGFVMHPKTRQPNLGLYDQLTVLRWVRRNIQTFGGDPVNVMIYGYGSGATCALALSYSPLGQHLFDKLWLSAPVPSYPQLSRDQAWRNSQSLFQCTKSQCPHSKFDQIGTVIKLWNWKQVDQWFKQSLFNFPSLVDRTDSTQIFSQSSTSTSRSSSSNTRHSNSSSSSSSSTLSLTNPLLNGILVDDEEIININQWHNPTFRTSLVIGQTSHELALYPTPEAFHFWTKSMYHQYIRDRLNSSLSEKNLYLQTKLRTLSSSSSSILNRPPCCRNMTREPAKIDIENEYTSLLTDGRFTCPLLNFVDQYLKPIQLDSYSTRHRIYQYYLSGKHRRFDPYALATYVSQAFHGWDAMIYLRSYLIHTDFQNAQLSQLATQYLPDPDISHGNNGDNDENEQHLIETSNLLNRAVFEFVRTGTISQWLISQPDQRIMNCIEQGSVCRLQLFFKERCEFWNYMFDSQWYDLIWPI